MKNNKSLKIKILLISILVIVTSIATYIYLPNISNALESKLSNIKDAIGKITASVGTNETNEKIREHRGYWNYAYNGSSYESASKPYGINDIDTYVSKYLEDAYNGTYGWQLSLRHNTSIFCQQKNTPFPHPSNIYMKTFHIGLLDTHKGGWNKADTEGAVYTDYIEHLKHDSWYGCTGENTLSLLPTNWTFEDVNPSYVSVDEFQFDWRNAGSSIAGDENASDVARNKEFIQHTLVTVDYSASAPYFDPMQSYYFSYSTRAYYSLDPAQYANWTYKNGAAAGIGANLYNAAAAVTHTLYGKVLNQTSNPSYGEISIVKPEMSATNANGDALKTGTIIDTDGTSYKVGPIYMKDYTYAWSTYVKEFSGTSSLGAKNTQDVVSRLDATEKEFYKGLICGIIEMKIELDNGQTLYVDGDNVKIAYSRIDSGRTTFSNAYYESPSLHAEYVFPSPKSEFYIDIPISSCVGATKISKITTRYKWTEVDGEVGDLNGTFHDLEWTGNKQLGGCNNSSYDCTNVIDGYECKTNDRTACYHTMNYYKHQFDCGTKGWCQYGSSTSSTRSNDVTSGSTRYTDKITSSCSSTWACGYYAHDHGNSLSSYQKEDGSYHEACMCAHTHSSYTGSCYRLNCDYGGTHTHGSGCSYGCGYSGGQRICGTTAHTHSSSCYHTHKSTCQNLGGGAWSCGYESGDKTCRVSAHTHTTSCYHYHSNSCCTKTQHTSHGASCYDLICLHRPGQTCYYSWCCKYYEHTHSIGTCGKTHNCSRNYCIHGFADGKHTCGVTYEHTGTGCSGPNWGDTHIGDCYGCGDEGRGNQDEYGATDEPSRCPHGHAFCAKCVWKCTDDTTKNSQKLNYVKWTEVYEKTAECYIENIPLVAKVEIEKYIYDVEHAKEGGNLDNSYGPSDDRRKLEEKTKENNPVYVESDDYVTYKIIMTNSSAFGVKIRIDDVLPEASAYKFVSAYLGTEKVTNVSDLRNKIIQLNANSEASVTVTLQVKVLKGKYENIAKIITRNGTPKNNTDDIDYIRTVDDDGPVVNHIETKCNGTTKAPEWESSDWFILNNYNTFIDKYVYKYDEKMQEENNNKLFVTQEESIVDSDDVLKESRLSPNKTTEKYSDPNDGNVEDVRRTQNKDHEDYKAAHPVNVEKYESVTYAIRVSNEAKEVTKNEPTGKKPATQFKPTIIEDKLHNGLQYSNITAKIYNSNGSVKQELLDLKDSCNLVGTEGEYNIYHITPPSTSIIINPGEYIEYYMEVKVVQSNMYLYSMNNSASLKKISNINDIDVTTRNIATQQETTEYIRMKDLVIAGYVWLDIDKNGLMDDKARSDLDKINNNISDNAMKKDILVRLYKVDNDGTAKLIRTTITDENGLYTFGRKDNSNSWYDTYNNTVTYEPDEKDGNGNPVVNGAKYQRIDKANNKDSNGNYTSASQYNSYFVEFVYDGVVYKSTQVYAGTDNLNNDGTFKKYANEIIDRYRIDSNAAELKADRENFNELYEYISYDVAYGYDSVNDTYNLTQKGELDFQKDFNESYLMEDSRREMTAKSFINTDTQKIKLLWLYPFSIGNRTTPETEYLKYINLGLELREDVDLALTKDVYNLKTTINGEEMEYDFNLGDKDGYLNDYIVQKPYGFEIYESDYKYRVEQYISKAVEEYKGSSGEDELNIEVTYRINLKNVKTRDDEEMAQDEKYKNNANINKNTPLDVKVHEVLDLYDENFKDYTEGAITAKVKDANGLLKDKQINVAEAWIFMTEAEAKGRTLLENGQKYTTRDSGGSKPIYVPDDNGEYVKVKLELSNTSEFSAKANNFTADGYKTVYIKGFEDQVIPEGEDLDIYVKYVVDKDKLEIEVSESYNETKEITKEALVVNETTQLVEKKTIGNDNISAIITNVKTETIGEETKTVTTAEIERAIKLAEKIKTTFKIANGRGTENIAQINAYSVWYENGEPASLVDKDSNAGNIGIKNNSTGKSPKGSGYSESITSADDITYYEDTTYKTGIELIAEGTENTKEDLVDRYSDLIKDENGTITIIGTSEPIRKITGTVWDDSRTDTLGSGNEIQYIADGKYDTSKSKQTDAKENANVALNYKDESVTEQKDIKVRNAKAEFIEVIKTDDNHYYEEVLTHVTWDQKQSARTDTDGFYTLQGFKPGTYIVRFTYGDTVENDETAKSDMLIFNGQDYKSTKYTGVPDSLNDVDAVIKAFEEPGVSDARDDEVRRLEVNTYSEVMTNEIAEILKGLANGTSLTPNSEKNSPEDLKALTDNTYMIADTREFLVKSEKLTTEQTISYTGGEYKFYYNALEALMNNHINQREFTINNVDLGIEYRPESQISLMKEIKEITLTTEDGNVLVNLHFKTNGDGDNRTHEIIKEKSKGYELVQFITNNYSIKPLINNIVSEEYLQGLVYIQVDEEILHGCTVEITYGFEAQNSSEIDRISTKLNAIRYRDNKATDDLIEQYTNKYKDAAHKSIALLDFTNVMKTRYTASALSKAAVFADTYALDNEGIVYREIPKATTTTGDDGYYGRFVGYAYYVGKLSEDVPDIVSSLKFDKILDYIDTNLEYEQKTAAEDLTDRLWNKITSRELISLVSRYKGLRETVKSMTDEELPKVTDIDGVEYKSMVVSVDDRNVDPGDPNDVEHVKNKNLSRFLLPKVSLVGINGNDEDARNEVDADGNTTYSKYTGSIFLDVSKVLAAGSDDDDKTYENMAEIVQFTTLNGRRTNFATTIGNADIESIKEKLEEKKPPFDNTTGNNSGSIEFITSSIEPDTSATETITLIPPTGLMKSRRAIVSIMETAKAGVEVMSMTGLVVAIIAAMVMLVLFIIRKYKKRRIK